MDIVGDVKEELGSHAQQAGSTVLDQLKKFPRTLIDQIKPGKSQSQEELAAAQKADSEFSESAHAQLVAKIYQDYHLEQAKKKQVATQQEAQHEEAQKLADLNEDKQQTQQDIAVAMGKGSAETSRSYGSE